MKYEIDKKEKYIELVDDYRDHQNNNLLGVIRLGEERFMPIIDTHVVSNLSEKIIRLPKG